MRFFVFDLFFFTLITEVSGMNSFSFVPFKLFKNMSNVNGPPILAFLLCSEVFNMMIAYDKMKQTSNKEISIEKKNEKIFSFYRNWRTYRDCTRSIVERRPS